MKKRSEYGWKLNDHIVKYKKDLDHIAFYFWSGKTQIIFSDKSQVVFSKNLAVKIDCFGSVSVVDKA